MSRRYTSKRDRAVIFLRQGGKCCGLPGAPCTHGPDEKPVKLEKGNHQIDHIIPVSPITGGTDTVANKQALCLICHRVKTRGKGATTAGSDICNIKKLRRRLKGERVTRHPFPGSRRSAFQKKMSGEVVRRYASTN
jgi:hypothetical protein